VNNSSFVQFAIWDFPGQIDFFDPAFEAEKVFDNCGAVIFVIDAQDDYTEAMQRLVQTVTKGSAAKADIKFEVFLHKVDGLSDETKMDTQREIVARWTEEALEAGLGDKSVQVRSLAGLLFANLLGQLRCLRDGLHLSCLLSFQQVAFHLTSIYDHSIFEAFSKVVQKLIPELSTLEELLNMFATVKALVHD
jgi:Ras-related GTP-binding protein C/D